MKDDSWDDDGLVELPYTPPLGWSVTLTLLADDALRSAAPLPTSSPRGRAARREERKQKQSEPR